MSVGAYEAVWLFVGFDLPTLTKDDRRRASRFRKDLLDLGFTMFQLSLYSHFYPSKRQAETVSRQIKPLVPPNGTVSVFYITDFQFGMIQTYFGGKHIEEAPPSQEILLL